MEKEPTEFWVVKYSYSNCEPEFLYCEDKETAYREAARYICKDLLEDYQYRLERNRFVGMVAQFYQNMKEKNYTYVYSYFWEILREHNYGGGNYVEVFQDLIIPAKKESEIDLEFMMDWIK